MKTKGQGMFHDRDMGKLPLHNKMGDYFPHQVDPNNPDIAMAGDIADGTAQNMEGAAPTQMSKAGVRQEVAVETEKEKLPTVKVTKAEIEAKEKKDALIKKSAEKGWSDAKNVRKGVTSDKAIEANLVSAKTGEGKTWKSTYNLFGKFKSLKEVKEEGGGGLKGLHVKTPHFSITTEQKQKTKVPQGKPNPFYLQTNIEKLKLRAKGYGPKHPHWKSGFQTDYSEGLQKTIHGTYKSPYDPGVAKPSSKVKTKTKINFEGWK